MRTPTREQTDALERFAAMNGRNWKYKLADAWSNGMYGIAGEDSTYLKEVESELGWKFVSKLD